MKMWDWSLALFSRLRIWCSCELWHWLGPAAWIWPLAWEPPYAGVEALKRQKKKKSSGSSRCRGHMLMVIRQLTSSIWWGFSIPRVLLWHSGLRIRCCYGYGIGLSWSSNLTPSPGTSICCRSGPRNRKKTKKKNPKKTNYSFLSLYCKDCIPK